ncbi:MAG TPA: hypothetical protein VK652_14410 [Steroidobacteraceae bacterium]|nr:hypothetical protein [Steroidobacteraceae bacterium]
MKSSYSRYFIITCICLSATLGPKTAAAQSPAYLFKVYGPTVTEQMTMEKTLAGEVLTKL